MLIPLAIALGVALFFRDPHRRAPRADGLVLAPADGRVSDVTEMAEDRFLRTDAVRIGIFLSVFDVHVNRAPCAGRIAWTEFRPGRFWAAFRQRAIDENGRNSIGMDLSGTPGRRIRFDQVTGAIARRIVCACGPGDRLSAGERFGMIRFGSRAEVWLPKSEVGTVRVKPGDRVRAGESVLAEWRGV